MSVIRDYHNLQKLPNQSTAVIQCGLTICHPGHHCRSRVYNHYSAHFILEGKGVYNTNGRSYELGPGQGFMIMPGVSNNYTADETQPWRYIYVSFCGVDDEVLVHNAGLNPENPTFVFPLDESMLQDLYAMYESSKSYDCKGYDVAGYFLLAMSRLIKDAVRQSQGMHAPEHYFQKALRYIEDHYSYHICVQDIAAYVGIERSYLYRIFVDHVQQSPSAYLREYRLLMGAKLLESGNLPLNEVALSVGFHDLSHFYKAFTARYQMTPKQYRTRNHTENNSGSNE